MANTAFSAVITISGTSNQLVVSGTSINPIMAIANNPVLPGTGSVTLPQGTTAQRSGGAGAIRFNSQTTELEATLDGASWVTLATTGGVVLSVSGTANRITSTGGVNPVIDIAATYVGQTSLVTLGVVTTGTWNATTIATTHGGTGLVSYVLGDLIYGSGVNVLSKLAGNITSGIQYLSQTGTGAVSAAPVWSTISGGDITGAALTKTDDTNVTMSLGGSPTTCLLRAASMTLGWTGTLAATRGGTGTGTYATGDTLYASAANTLSKLSGNTTVVKQYLSQTGDGVNSAAPVWATISGGDITGAALTKVDDTNVTLTLGGSPSTALLRAASITAGWTGQLSLTRGGTNASLTADLGGIVYSTASALAILASTATAGKVLQSGASAAPAWSTPTYPSASGTAGKILRSDGTNNVYSTSTFADTYSASNLLYSNGANTVTGLATANRAVLTTSATGVPVLTALATDGQLIIGSTAGAPAAATLTAGSGVTITNASNSITISATGSGGTVTSVSGTANRITSTGGTTPVIDISASYVGQSSLTTLGTITTGTWNGSVIGMAYGGTNANLTASTGGIVYSGASALAILSGTATARQMLQSGASAAPTWSTTTWPATTTANRILYSSATSVIGEITSANSATLYTDSSGVPAFTGSMTNGQLLIGSTGASPALATLTAGSGITITNAAGGITITSTSSGGTWVKISSSAASSSASIAFTGLSATYMMYLVVIDRALPATDAVGFEAQVSTDNGSTYKTTNEYDYADMIPWNTDGSYNARGGSGVGAILVTGTDSSYNIGNASNRGITGQFYIYNPSNASYGRTTGNFSYTTAGGALRASNHAGVFNSATAINAIRFLFSSGNITSGTFTLYGLAA